MESFTNYTDSGARSGLRGRRDNGRCLLRRGALSWLLIVRATESKVIFETVWQLPPGLKGVIDRVTTPFFMHIVYRKEMEILNAYAQQQVQLGQTADEKNKNKT